MGGERDAGESPQCEADFPTGTFPVTRAFQRDDDGVEEVATEHLFVTSKGNANFNPRFIAEEFMDKVKIEPLGALRASKL